MKCILLLMLISTMYYCSFARISKIEALEPYVNTDPNVIQLVMLAQVVELGAELQKQNPNDMRVSMGIMQKFGPTVTLDSLYLYTEQMIKRYNVMTRMNHQKFPMVNIVTIDPLQVSVPGYATYSAELSACLSNPNRIPFLPFQTQMHNMSIVSVVRAYEKLRQQYLRQRDIQNFNDMMQGLNDLNFSSGSSGSSYSAPRESGMDMTCGICGEKYYAWPGSMSCPNCSAPKY